MTVIEPIVSRHVPASGIAACIRDHQRGIRTRISSPGLIEPVFKTACIHRLSGGKSFEWWVVSFPKQRRIFLGPPEFFEGFFP